MRSGEDVLLLSSKLTLLLLPLVQLFLTAAQRRSPDHVAAGSPRGPAIQAPPALPAPSQPATWESQAECRLCVVMCVHVGGQQPPGETVQVREPSRDAFGGWDPLVTFAHLCF